MEILGYTYLFIFGLVFGSFYNVVGIRLAHNESIVFPRSHCPHCGHTLTATELIPALSYLFQKGRCRNCSASVSAKYPFFELLTASLFTISPLLTGWSKDLPVALVLVSLVVIVSIADIDSMIIPNKVLLFFGITGILLRLFIPTVPWWNGWVGAVTGFIMLSLIAILSKDGMGGGDIKYFAVLGLFVGVKGIVLSLVLAAVLGLVYGLFAILILKKDRKEPIPFGPFIGAATLIIFYFDEQIGNLLKLLYI